MPAPMLARMRATAIPDLSPPRLPFVSDPRAISGSGALLAILVAAIGRGRVHPDEVFQFLEPAHHLAFGPWIPAWEWFDGLRNWAVPGLLAGLLKASSAAGLTHPWAYTAVIWLACASAQAAATFCLYRLVEERDGTFAAVLAATIHASWGGFLLFAARPIGDALSIAPLVPALLFTQRASRSGSGREGLIAGVLIGVAFVVRYPSAVFGFPLVVTLLLARRWRATLAFGVGAAVVLAALGVLDWLTWGRPFHSAIAYLMFNIIHGSSARFGRMPPGWYLPIFAGMAPMLLSWHFLRGLARGGLVTGAFVTYFATISLLAHKEARFLVPLLPLFIAIGAGPAARDLEGLLRRSPRWSALMVAIYVAASVCSATVQAPLALHAPVIDAMVSVGRAPDLAGLLVAGPDWWSTGGRYYLHRDIPLAFEAEPDKVRAALADPNISHVIMERTHVSEEALVRARFHLLNRERGVSLWKRSP